MRITTVKLCNIGVFRSKTFDLSSDLIAIVGPNGAGKSTLINSIYAALTNDFSRFGSVKASVINNVSEDQPSYILLTGVHAGREFTLLRGLRPSKNEFSWAGEKYTRAGDVDMAVQTILGVSKTVIDKYVFVSQRGMTEFILQTPGDRAKLFQHLCGVEQAAEIHKACTGFLLRNRFVDVAVDLAAIDADIAATNRKCAESRQGVRASWSQMLRPDVVKQMQTEIFSASQRAADAERESVLQRGVIELQQAKVVVSRQLTALQREIEPRRTWLEQNKAYYEQVSGVRYLIERIAQLTTQQAGLQAQYAEVLGRTLQPPEKPAGYLPPESQDGALQAVERARIALRQYQTASGQANATCPTCYQPIGAPHIETLRIAADTAAAEAAGLHEAVSASRRYDQEVVHFAQRQQQSANTQRALQAQLQALDAELADAQAKRAAAPYEDPQEFVKSYDTTQHWCNHATSRSQQFESDLRDIETRLDSSYAELQRLATHVTGPVLTQTEIVERRQRLAAHMNAVELYRSSRTVHSTYADMLGALWRRKTTAEARVQEAAKRNERLGVAERVAETFHWDKLPKLIAQRNLQLLIEDVNVNLQDFQAPFRVQASSDLSFAVSFPDRNLLEAVQLSGGQQVMLSLAFRLSLDRIFGSSIGLLCFDEPSAGLDVRNQQIFYETLRTIVGRTAEPRQVIVVTHTAGLGQFFDRRIELDDASVELLSVA